MTPRWLSVVLLLATAVALGSGLSFQEHSAVQESLSRVHPRMRASWLRERGLDDSYYTTFRKSDSQGLHEVGRWSFGPSYDVDGRVTPTETLVALARGSGVSLIRFSRADSLQLELLADINAPGLLNRVWVRDTLLYVGSAAGLEIWNIAEERNPARLSWIQTALNDFDVQDSLAYVIGADDSFKVYNVSDPANPAFRGACRDSGYDISVCNGYAYVGDRWGLYVIDVSNPASPHRIGSWGSAIEQVKARGTLCYVTTFNPNQPGEITFHVLDITIPANPQQIGSLDSAGGNDVDLVDTLAFCSGEYNFNKLTIVSVADSTRPRVVGVAGTPGWSMGIWASGLAQSTFVGCHWEGLQVFDTRNPAQPVRDTLLLGADMSVDVCVDSGRAYVANARAGLKILDVSDPTRPSSLGSYDTAGQAPDMRSAAAKDSFAFAGWGRPALLTLNVSDPTHPVVAGGCDSVINLPEDMVLRDSFVYVAEQSHLQIVNVARPREPVLVGSCVTMDGTYFGLAVQDSLAYLMSGWLQVINIARPNAPFIVSTTAGGATGIAVRDTFAYIPNGWDSVHVYSVANPASPRLVSSAPCGVWPWDAALGESKLYVGTSDGWGVDVYDLANPGQPVRRGRASAPTDIRRLCYSNGLLYAAMWEAGVAIYETTSTAVCEPGAMESRRPKLRVWPSVATDCVRFSADGTTRDFDIAVFDISGMRLSNVPVQAETKGGATQGKIGFVGLPAGVYVVRVSSQGTNLTAKVVRTKGR